MKSITFISILTVFVVILLCCPQGNCRSAKSLFATKATTAKLSITLDSLRTDDTLILRVYEHIVSVEGKAVLDFISPFQEFSSTPIKGQFTYTINGLSKPKAFQLFVKNSNRLRDLPIALFVENNHILEGGDDISIHFGAARPSISKSTQRAIFWVPSDSISYKGRGSSKLICIHTLEQLEKVQTSNAKFIFNVDVEIEEWKRFIAFKDALLSQQLEVLDNYHYKLSAYAYNWFKAYIIGKCNSDKILVGKGVITSLDGFINAGKIVKGITPIVLDSIRSVLRFEMANMLNTEINPRGIPLDILSDSKYFKRFVVRKAIAKYQYGLQEMAPYSFLKTNYSGEFRDGLIATLVADFNETLGLDSVLEDAMRTVRAYYSIEVIRQVSDQRSKGKPAYAFNLVDQKGRSVKLSSFLGKVVFIDFWYSGCGGCINFYRYNLSKVEKAFQNQPIIFISVNVDEPEAWVSSLKLGIYTSVDEENVLNLNAREEELTKLQRYYGLHAYPRPILIDRKGNIASLDMKMIRSEQILSKEIKRVLMEN